MDPVSLDVALLKLRFPELILRPGMQVVARVASRGEGPRAALVLAGQLMSASVPEEVRAGDTLRLTVAEISPERVLLQLESAVAAPQDPAALAAQGPPAPGTAPPATLRPDEDAEAEARRASAPAGVSLTYQTAALGRLDLHVEGDVSGTTVIVSAPRGSHGLARQQAEELRIALEERTGHPARVTVRLRHEPFDAYA